MLRTVEDLLNELGIEVSREAVRLRWRRSGSMLAAEICMGRAGAPLASSWHLDEVFVRSNGVPHHLGRAVAREEALAAFVPKRRKEAAALRSPKEPIRRPGRAKEIVTDKLRPQAAALKGICGADRRATKRRENDRAENSHQPLRPRKRATT